MTTTVKAFAAGVCTLVCVSAALFLLDAVLKDLFPPAPPTVAAAPAKLFRYDFPDYTCFVQQGQTQLQCYVKTAP